MVVSIAELIIVGLLVDYIFRKCRVPGLIGLLLVGFTFGPYALDLMPSEILAVAPELRMTALLVILLRAGLEISKSTLLRVATRAVLLACLPPLAEAAAVTLLAPRLLGLSTLEAAILGAILAAVSPAVVVTSMVHFIKRRMGARKGIPTMVLAAASLNDVLVLVVFGMLLGLYTGQCVNVAVELVGIPISILAGTAAGLLIGSGLIVLFDKFNPRATKRLLALLGIAVLLYRVEELVVEIFPFTALLAVMAIGFIILEKREHYAHEISAKLGKVWVLAEIVLFALVGAQVNVGVAWHSGAAALVLILAGLLARSLAGYLCLQRSDLTARERTFVVLAYLPKATVQAAIGAAPLAAMQAYGMNTGPGEIILAAAVLSILVTAPLGAWATHAYGDRVLVVSPPKFSDATDAALESEATEDA